ncbi:uncharacterized protein UTRI_06131 [Ustilago trichophora]|uniref:Copper acquisition factor BIM1-like domain-containing protein n=1 Tax=Ustilago trichophora TaxID=86804 RepID=A0A5C3EFH1_9BASI|nr:uncharacterized protein UTRI_06131 [Ustilago trichophora]
MKLSATLSLLCLLALTSWAHFALDSPKTHGFDEDKESSNFCGGFPDVSLLRQPWYYCNGPIVTGHKSQFEKDTQNLNQGLEPQPVHIQQGRSTAKTTGEHQEHSCLILVVSYIALLQRLSPLCRIASERSVHRINIYIAFDVPTSAQSFLTTANGTTIPPLRHDLAIKGTGVFCFHANAADLNVAGVKVGSGTNATIMVEYINDVHRHLYQCSDVTLTDDAEVGANVSCLDLLTGASASASKSASGSSSGSGSASAATLSAPAANKANGVMAIGIPMCSLALLPALAAGALFLA